MYLLRKNDAIRFAHHDVAHVRSQWCDVCPIWRSHTSLGEADIIAEIRKWERARLCANTRPDVRTDFEQKFSFASHSRKRAERTSLGTINFSVFRRAKSCKVILSGDWLRPNPSKIYSSKGACSFRRIDFFSDEPKFLRNIQIFKRISAMYGGKSIF